MQFLTDHKNTGREIAEGLVGRVDWSSTTFWRRELDIVCPATYFMHSDRLTASPAI